MRICRMDEKMTHVVIVDGYSGGRLLAHLFKQQGFKVLHIQSNHQLHAYYLMTFDSAQYSDLINFEQDCHGNFIELCKILAQYPINFALAGVDSGVYLADKINNHFSLSGNNLGLSLTRKNKYLQRLHLTNIHQHNTPYYLADQPDKFKSWLQKQGQWPIVIKPLESANSQDVKLCHNLEQATRAFEHIIQTGVNQCGIPNNAALAEHYLAGREYRINTVSYQSKHYLAEVWDVTKRVNAKGDFIYHCIKLIDPENMALSILKTYFFQLLDAFEISHGPAAADIVITENKTPVLIELHARLMGEVVSQQALNKSLSLTQIQATCLAYSNSAAFLKKTTHPYQTQNGLEIYFLNNKKKSKVKKINFLDEIQRLPSVIDIKQHVFVEDNIEMTTDYASSPMQIILSHQCRKQLQEDKKKVEDYEHLGIFMLD